MPASKNYVTAMFNLAEIPILSLAGVGTAMVEKLARLNIFTLQDLLLHLPLRYEDRTHQTPLNQLKVGEYATIEGRVCHAEVNLGRRKMLLVTLSDGHSKITFRFFNFNTGMHKSFQIWAKEGVKLRAFGEIKGGKFGFEMLHPEYQIINAQEQNFYSQTHLTPIYPSTFGISQNMWRKLMSNALAYLEKLNLTELIEFQPSELRKFFLNSEGLFIADLSQEQFTFKQALIYLHNPPAKANLELLTEFKHPAQQRLIFEELLAHHLALSNLCRHNNQLKAYPLKNSEDLTCKFLANLPFVPTSAQTRVSQEIAQDLAQANPMLRLVQGDVGSGKTLVAGLASLQALGNGLQVAIMSPTEILAEQHWQNFNHWFAPLGIQVDLLTGKTKAKERREILSRIANGESQVIIGTHALFQEEVQFQRLGLIIIDEQHRFGVQQRLQLREKGNFGEYFPHQLIMTATPIPRTLAMTMYADLDLSIIDELPKDRSPIKTVVISQDRRAELMERINHVCQVENRQAYWVCTLIDESETLEAQSANALFEELSQALPELKIGLIHGRMTAKEKQVVMASFKAGELQLLVATTVIEVGVDVPNASLMIIENAERLGLSQLHQLRGRVGRGTTESFCVLMYKSPLGKIAQERLAVMRQTQDGFVIAEKDLVLRGAGEILGFRQTGEVNFKVANLVRDSQLIPAVQKLAQWIWQHQPQKVESLVQRWINTAESSRYS